MTSSKDTSKVKHRKASKQNSVDGKDQQPSGKLSLKYGPLPTFPHQRIWTRMVLILGSLVVVYFTSSSDRVIMFAKQKETLENRRQNVLCSQDYSEELKNFPGCVPTKCGRTVMDRLVTAKEADALMDIGKRGLALGGSEGGASILDLHSGALSKGRNFVNIYKLNVSNIFNSKDFALYKAVRTKIQQAVAHSFKISPDYLYLTHPTFFSQLTSDPPVTAHDEYWHAHVDKLTYKSFHYTSLLYLNDYGVDYEGGRFIFIEPDNSTVVLEPRKGRVSMFTSGKENVHLVEKVISGVRYAMTVSFTCDSRYAIADPSMAKLSQKG